MPFTLKYRPRTLDDMVGQEPAVLQVRGMFDRGELGSSFLITGPTGSGKTTMARIIAHMANGSDKEYAADQELIKYIESNNEDFGSLNYRLQQSHVNYKQAYFKAAKNKDKSEHHTVSKEEILLQLKSKTYELVDTVEINGADTRGIEDIRQLIRASKFAPKRNYRIYILDEMHQLTPQAQQAFLKTLEEPSPRTIFILCTNEPEKLPDTIIGRCQQIRLSKVSLKTCALLLKKIAETEGFNLPVDVLKQLAYLTKGCLRESLQALEAVCNYVAGGGDVNDADSIASAVEQVVLVPPSDYLQKYLLSIYKGSYVTALRIANIVENVDYFIRCLMDIHEQAMFSLISPKLITAYSERWSSTVLEKSKLSQDDVMIMSDMLDEMVKSAALVGQYTVDAKHVLLALTTRLVTMMKRTTQESNDQE